MGLVIRRVTAADIQPVRASLVETWHATYDQVYGPAKVLDITARWHHVDVLAAQAVDPVCAFFLAEDQGILASSLAKRISPDVTHLYRLYVRPMAQRRGLGAALMAATFDALPGGTCHRLEVAPENEAAIGFYRRAGFREVRRIGDCGGSSGVPALIMERTISAGTSA